LKILKNENLKSKLFVFKSISLNYGTLRFDGPSVLLVDFMNLQDDGQEVRIKINTNNKVINGRMYLHKCNMT
jgi:hypothetical protein